MEKHDIIALRYVIERMPHRMNTSTKIWNISTQQVQIFLKAVELKNFTQVANQLGFTPSMISKTISNMEKELDLVLFIRKPHELSPTPTAQYLAKEWKQFINAFDNSIKKAHSYEKSLEHNIALGFVDSSVEVDQMFQNVITDYLVQKPYVKITAEKHDMHRLVELLNTGMLDIVQTCNFEIPYLEEHGLVWEKVIDSNAAVYIPQGNELFYQTDIQPSDLAKQPIISLDPIMHPSYSRWLNDLCQKYGFIPDIKMTYRTVRSLLFSLKINNCIFIGDTITSDWCDNTLKKYVLPDKTFSLLAWRKHPDKELMDFKKYLKTKYPATDSKKKID